MVTDHERQVWFWRLTAAQKDIQQAANLGLAAAAATAGFTLEAMGDWGGYASLAAALSAVLWWTAFCEERRYRVAIRRLIDEARTAGFVAHLNAHYEVTGVADRRSH